MSTSPPPLPSTAPAQAKNCALAVWSLVLGILSLACLSILSGIPAVICGHTALSRIRHSAGMLKGQGLAIAGLVTGYFSIAMIPIILMLAAIAVPNFIKARETAQMHACINNLRQIDGAKQLWALENKKEESAIPTPQELEAYLKTSLASVKCPAGGVYTIGPVGQKPTCSRPGHALPE